jgi:hypothetical protein
MCASGGKFSMMTQRLGRSYLKSLLTFSTLALVASTACAQSALPMFGPSGVSPLAVRQGILGSCYFHASLAAVAKAAPLALRNAIRGNAQTGYRVHFVSGPDELVYSQDLEYAQAHNYDRSEGLWVAILMRGYAQRKLRQSMILAVQRSTVIPIFVKPVALSALDESGPLLVAYDRAIRSVVAQDGKLDGQLDKAALQAKLADELNALGVTATQAQVIGGLLEHAGFYEALNTTVHENGEVFGAYRSLGQGGIPRGVLEAFLGTAHAATVLGDPAALATQLHNLHAGGTAMVAGSRPVVSDPVFQANKPDWFIPDHAYTVLDYDDASHIITLRNPWGTHPGPNGVFRLTLAVFEKTYMNYCSSQVAQQ